MSVTGFLAISGNDKARLLINPYSTVLRFQMEHRDVETNAIKNWVSLDLQPSTVALLVHFILQWQEVTQGESPPPEPPNSGAPEVQAAEAEAK